MFYLFRNKIALRLRFKYKTPNTGEGGGRRMREKGVAIEMQFRIAI